MVGRHEDHRNRTRSIQFHSNFDPVDFRHLDIKNHEIGIRLMTDGHHLAAITRHTDHIVTKPGENGLIVFSHVGFIISDSDAQSSIHLSEILK